MSIVVVVMKNVRKMIMVALNKIRIKLSIYGTVDSSTRFFRFA